MAPRYQIIHASCMAEESKAMMGAPAMVRPRYLRDGRVVLNRLGAGLLGQGNFNGLKLSKNFTLPLAL